MKLFSSILGTLVLGFSLGVMAEGREVGNGGDAVVCYTDSTKINIRSIQLLDHWEMDQVLHYPGGIQLGSNDLSVKQKIELALARIKKFDVGTESQVRDVAISIVDHINDFLVNQVPDIDDAHSRVPISGNCFMEQLAMQIKQPQVGERRFQILKKLYNHPLLSNDDRAGLILHEAIYRRVIASGGDTSDGVRYYNYVISTNHLDNATQETYDSVVMNSIFINVSDHSYKECEYNSIPGFNHKVLTRQSFEGVSTSERWILCEATTISWSSMELSLSIGDAVVVDKQKHDVMLLSRDGLHSAVSILQNGKWLTRKMKNDTWVTLDRNGYPQKLTMTLNNDNSVPDYRLYTPGNNPIQCNQSDSQSRVRVSEYNLSSGGEILGCMLSSIFEQFFTVSGKTYHLAKGSTLNLYSDHKFKSASFEHETLFKVQGSERVYAFRKSYSMNFNTKGEVTAGYLAQPFSMIINGFETQVQRIAIMENNLNRVTAFHYLQDATYMGKRILSSDPKPGFSIIVPNLKRLCGPSYIDAKEVNFKTIYLGQGEEFYDPKINQMVYRVDSHVNLVDKLVCVGFFDVPLP